MDYYILWNIPVAKMGKHEPKIEHQGFKPAWLLEHIDGEALFFIAICKKFGVDFC
jgi:hypothetical protein